MFWGGWVNIFSIGDFSLKLEVNFPYTHKKENHNGPAVSKI